MGNVSAKNMIPTKEELENIGVDGKIPQNEGEEGHPAVVNKPIKPVIGYLCFVNKEETWREKYTNRLYDYKKTYKCIAFLDSDLKDKTLEEYLNCYDMLDFGTVYKLYDFKNTMLEIHPSLTEQYNIETGISKYEGPDYNINLYENNKKLLKGLKKNIE